MNNGSESNSIRLADRNGKHELSSAQAHLMNVPLDGATHTSHAAPIGNELARLKQMMRGRWSYATAAATIGAIVCGLAGYKSGKKIYASVGEIHVVAVVPRVLYSIEEKNAPQMFDNFVESQMSLLQNQRVMERAMLDPIWKPLKRAPSEAAVQSLMHCIEVAHAGELITLRATDTDPAVAVASARSVVHAFEKIREDDDADSNEKRFLVLQNIQSAKGNELAAIREEISNIARPYGTDNLEHLFNIKQTDVEKLETQIRDTESDLILAARSRAGSKLPDQMTPEQWATVSAEMSSLLHDRSQAKRNLDLLRAADLMENNKLVETAKSVLMINEKAIQDLAVQLQAQRAAGLLVLPTQDPSSANRHPLLLDPDTLREQIEDLKKRRDTAKAEMIAVGDNQRQIADLKSKEDQVVHERDAAQQRIDQLNTEATISGRVIIVNDGSSPLSPYKDTHIPYAAAGIFGGGLIGFATVFVLAFFDRRLRSPDETERIAPQLTLLGLLPRLPDDLSGTAHDARAAHCVTGVRNLLQLSGRAGNRQVIVITSPVPGAGKTSLTFALGVSYATARLKTLMIDCDFVGGGLTARADKVIVRKLGHLLMRDNHIDEFQLAEALTAAKEKARRLGEIVVERGWASQEEIDRLLIVQQQETVGLLDAMDGAPIDQCITATGIQNLALLPIGQASSRHVPMLSAEALKKVFNAARKEYDVVLIDTGPVPGSLEAQLAAAVADATVVVVTPGVRRPLILNCIERLTSVGAKVAGLVYNRASDSEVFVYTSGSQPRLSRNGEISLQSNGHSVAVANAEPANFGPLAAAVTRAAPDKKTTRLARPFIAVQDESQSREQP